MADDAFALSPISARASLPSEADYGAIRDAFMETSRGRWFLDEYAKRNRSADTGQVLDAVARLETSLAARLSSQPSAESIYDAIRPLIAEARAAADLAMTSSRDKATVAAGRRASRIIREISWSLRETGTDPRICNILDTQLLALDAVHDQAESDIPTAQIGEVFDDLLFRFEEIASSPSIAAPTKAEVTAAKPEPVERVDANVAIAEPEFAETAVAAESPAAPALVAVAADDVGSSPTEDEMATDDAVLDLIAMEMAAPDIDDVDSFDETETALPEIQDIAASVASELVVAPVEMVAATIATVTPAAPASLGAALIASGIVARPRRNSDALAPFRRMSQIEKIAFFS